MFAAPWLRGADALRSVSKPSALQQPEGAEAPRISFGKSEKLVSGAVCAGMREWDMRLEGRLSTPIPTWSRVTPLLGQGIGRDGIWRMLSQIHTEQLIWFMY